VPDETTCGLDAGSSAPPGERYVRLLERLAGGYAQLLSSLDPPRLLPELLADLSGALNATCCCYMQCYITETGSWRARLIYASPAGERPAAAPAGSWEERSFAELGLLDWEEQLAAGQRVTLNSGETENPCACAFCEAACRITLLPGRRGMGQEGCLVLGDPCCTPRFTEQELTALQGLPAAISDALVHYETDRLLNEAHTELLNIMRSSTEYAVIATSLSWRVLHCNPMAEAMFEQLTAGGVGRDLAATGVLELMGQDAAAAITQAAASGQAWEAEFARPGGNGQPQIIHAEVSGMFNQQGVLCGYLIFARDVSELQRQERSLLEQQRMQSIGLLAGGVAHDFNNILMGILGYASLAKDRLEQEHPAYRMLSTIEQSAERAADLTRALLAYARGGRFETSPVMLDTMTEELLDILRTNLPKGIVIEKQFAERMPYVLADPAQVQQVIMNLCLNAGDAITQKKTTPGFADITGQIRLRTGVRVVDPGEFVQLGLRAEAAGTEFAFLEVTDNGCGMDEATLKRIFEPFFTTKFAGRGLGLAAVEGIVHNHNGSLQARSIVGEGTTFMLYLPAAGYLALQEEELPLAAFGAGETILVVEDEEIVSQLALLTLTNLGYQVMLAHDGAEGLAAFAAQAGNIDMVLLDITLPGRGGAELLDDFLALKHGTPVLLTSGFDETVATGPISEGKAVGFLRKPYAPETLARAVRAILDKNDQSEAN
jgi:signal transduction histidine kinase/ActR/RegA family two-component response regulator